MPTKTIDVGKELPDLQVLLSLVAQGTEVVLTEGEIPVIVHHGETAERGALASCSSYS